MQSRTHNSAGYGEKYQGLMRYFPSSMSFTFFIRVTTSSLPCVTILPDCRGVFSAEGISCESSSIGVTVGVAGATTAGGGGGAGVTGVAGAGVDIEGVFRFRLIFFWSAAARTALPLTWTSGVCEWTGLVGREVEINRFGVETPVVVFWPVVNPSLRGNWTFRVSKSSSRTHSSSLLLTKKSFVIVCEEERELELTYSPHSVHNMKRCRCLL